MCVCVYTVMQIERKLYIKKDEGKTLHDFVNYI